jgi:prevent-host-death family protein
MSAITVGIRELKTRLGKYMERVQAGGTVIITDRGKPVGRIIPIGTSLEVHPGAGASRTAGVEWETINAPYTSCSHKGKTHCCGFAH